MHLSKELISVFEELDLCIYKVNTQYDICDYLYCKSTLMCENVPFSNMIEKLIDSVGIIDTGIILSEFKKWIIDDSKHYIFNAFNKFNTKMTFVATKIKLNEYEFLIILENLDNKKHFYESIDSLTNLYEKTAFLNKVHERLAQDKKPFSLCIIDVDNFKGINDNYGHMLGDEILVKIANVLKRNITNGFVGRFGGDEFVFVNYDSVEYQDAWNLLYKIAHEINDIGAEISLSVDLSVTMGLARFAYDASDFEELFQCADRALYRGKRKGKNCFIIYDAEKHKNITLDGVRKTIIDDRSNNFTILNLLIRMFDTLNGKKESKSILEDVLKLILSVYNFDRVVLYNESIDRIEKPYICIYNEDSEKKVEPPNDISADIWEEHYKNGVCSMQRTVNLKGINDILYEKLYCEKINSVLRTSLEYKNVKIGVLEIVSYDEYEWSNDDINMITIIGYFLSLALYKEHENTYAEHIANTDELTGLINYSRFLNLATTKLNSSNKKCAGYYINIERFKSINSRFGFSAGDFILKKLADLLKKTFKDGIICRMSSDRFVVLDDYISDSDISNKFNIISADMKKLVYNGEKVGQYLVVSAGVYVTDGSENVVSIILDKAIISRNSLDDLFESSCAIFTKEMQQKFDKKQEIEMHFPIALKNKEFLLYLQPKFDIEKGTLIGAEALSRWKFNKEHILSPAEYIPRLEETGLIVDLDLHMFEELCRYMRLALDNKMKIDIPVSINLSRNQKNSEEYISKIESIRKQYNISPSLIEIEITESTFTENIVDIKKLIYYIHRLGYKVAMDDFGSGYSNLSGLVECGFDIIKIDKSLCTSTKNDKKNIILEAVINMANKLGMQVICEGVETKAQANNLLSLGCKFAQGFLYDKPLPVNEFIAKYVEENHGN